MSRRAKSIIWILASVGIVLAVGAMLVAGGYANGILRGLAQRALSWEEDEVCLIGEIQGNPLGNCRIVDVQFGDWVRVDTLDVAYNFLGLLIGKVVVHQLRLSGIEVSIDASDEETEAPGWDVPPPLDLDIESLEIADANVVVDGTQVRDISLKGAIFAGESEYRLILERFRSVQFDPPLEVTNLSGIAILQSDHLQLNDVALHTHGSRILLSGSVRQLDDPEVDLVVEADSLWLGDLRLLVDLPERDMQMRGNVKGSLQSLVTELVVKDEEVSIAFNGVMGIAPFTVRGEVIFEIDTDDLISLGYTGFDADLPRISTSLDGMITFAVDSSGVENAVAGGIFRRVQFGDARFDSVRFAINLANDLVRTQVTANGPSGNIVGNGEARLTTWDGKWEMRFRDLYAEHLPGVSQKVGRVTGRIDGARYIDQRLFIDHFETYFQNWGTRANGNGRLHFEGEKPAIAGNIQAEVALSSLTGTSRWGTSLTLAGNVDGIAGGDLTVELTGNIVDNAAADSLCISALVNAEGRSDIRANLSGTGGVFSTQGYIDRHLEGQWMMDVRDLEAIGEVIDIDLSGTLALSGTWSGTLDAPGFSARGNADSLVVADIPLQNLTIETQWARPDSGVVNLQVGRLTWGGRSLQEVFFEAVYAHGETSFLLDSGAQVDDRVLFQGRAGQKEEHLQVAMDSLYVKVDQVVLHNEGPVQFAYSPAHGIHIGHFVLSGPAGRLVAQDQQDFQATVEVLLKDLDLRLWAFLAGASGMGGILNGEVLFAGTLSDPLIFFQFALAKGEISGVGFDSAAGEVSLGNDRIHFEVKVVPDGDEVLALFGSLPVTGTGDMHLRAWSEGVAIRTHSNAKGVKRSERLTLGTVPNAYFDVSEGLTGMVLFDLEARGRFEQPDIRGVVEIRDGVFDMPGLNRSFASVSGRAVVGDGKIRIDSLAMGTSANLAGDIMLEGFLPGRWDLSAQFRDFEPVALPELQLVTDGQLQITGTLQGIKVEGKMAMKQAEIRLAELLGVPSLATKQAEIRLTELFEEPSPEMPTFLRDPEINLQVSADRQVWLRDPAFEVEIEGDLDVIKNREDSRIYGMISSRRGNYIWQNNRLRITRGEIQFQGRPDWNPDLDIRAETSVRAVSIEGERPKPVDIIVTVGGTLTYPQISFDSSDPSLEGDMGNIASLLLTGRPADQFQFSGGHTLDLFAGFVANRLGQHIGQKLHLDLVEIDVGEGNISRIRLGKYIGDRLFMSYAKDISSTAYEAAMEFEIFPEVIVEASQIEEVNVDTNNRRRRGSVGLFWEKEW
ncbi:MAG: translocation/assembly module TamB [Gemmatimonadetes bacterium]|nr:translocation/assembly module TamB [Gemmatimonadota bacterium]